MFAGFKAKNCAFLTAPEALKKIADGLTDSVVATAFEFDEGDEVASEIQHMGGDDHLFGGGRID